MAEPGGGSLRDRSRSRQRSAIAATEPASDAIVQGAADTLEAMLDEVVTLHDELAARRQALAEPHDEDLEESQAGAYGSDRFIALGKWYFLSAKTAEQSLAF